MDPSLEIWNNRFLSVKKLTVLELLFLEHSVYNLKLSIRDPSRIAESLDYWIQETKILFQRYVPFAAVAAANCANIPLMRQNEIANGVDLIDEDGRKLTKSKVHIIYR